MFPVRTNKPPSIVLDEVRRLLARGLLAPFLFHFSSKEKAISLSLSQACNLGDLIWHGEGVGPSLAQEIKPRNWDSTALLQK